MPKLTVRRVLTALSLCCFLIGMYAVISPRFLQVHSPLGYGRHDASIRKKLHYSVFRSDTFDDFVSQNAHLERKPLADRCRVFFDDFLSKNPDYLFPDLTSRRYEKNILNMQAYFNGVKDMASEKRPSGRTRERVYEEFEQRIEQTFAIEKEMVDTITLIRAYSQCVFGDDPTPGLGAKMNHHLFPYLTTHTPKYEYYGGQEPLTFYNGVPDLSLGKFDGKVITIKKDEDLLLFYHRSLNGRGIVISATTRHARDVAKMIRVLRALNNKLPIQLVYRGLMSEKSKRMLMQVCTEDKEDLLRSLESTKDIWPDIDLLSDAAKFGCEFPKQEIWFVDIKACLGSQKIFKGYNNKLVALLFNSFQEVVLIDADTVPLVPPQKFFESREYNHTKTLFFKDRSLRDWNQYIETNFCLNLMPINNDPLDKFLGVKPIGVDKLKDNNFLRGWRHYQEAGVVVIDKKKHFKSMPMLLTLGLIGEPIKTSFWGDKEFYWLALLLSGDQDYAFNTYEAASVGELTTNPLYQAYKSDTRELCSSHPGHVNENGELLWINSGFSYCKKNGSIRDRKHFPFTQMDDEVVKQLYGDPLKILHALVPPSLPNYRDFTLTSISYEKEHKPVWETSTIDFDEGDKDTLNPNIEELPHKPWVKNGLCTSYHYCAYDRVDPSPYGVELGTGTLFTFSEAEVNKFSYLGKLWLTTSTVYRDNLEKGSLPVVEQQVKPPA